MLINIKMDIYDLAEMLTDRISVWTQDNDVCDLYYYYYLECALNGGFDNVQLDVRVIADNDYINYTEVLPETEISEDNRDRIIFEHNGLYLLRV